MAAMGLTDYGAPSPRARRWGTRGDPAYERGRPCPSPGEGGRFVCPGPPRLDRREGTRPPPRMGDRRPCDAEVTRDLRRPPARQRSCWWARRSCSSRSSRCGSPRGVGLPSLLIYLLMGVAARRGRARHPVRGRRARPRPRLRGPGDDPGRGWSDHPLAPRCGRRCGSASRWPRSGSPSAVAWSRSARTTCSACLGAGGPAGRGHLADRRRRGVLGAARVPLPERLTGALEAESGLNDAPTVVLVTLVSTGARSPTHGLLGMPGSSSTSWSPACWSACVVGFGGAWVMRRAALPSSGLYPLAVLSPGRPRVRRRGGRARVRLRRGVRRRAGPRQLRAAAPGRDPVLRRGPRLAGADRAVRDARAAALAGPDHR